MFYSIVTLAQKIASSVAIPLALLLLQAAGYRGATAAGGEMIAATVGQDARALNAIRLLVGPVPAALLLVGILFALNYPLTREEHRRVAAELELRRGE
jgi:GPH family glycoside/pentoside/hexuronide:cation symporter